MRTKRTAVISVLFIIIRCSSVNSEKGPSEKELRYILEQLRQSYQEFSLDTTGQKIEKNNDTSFTLISYHSNGKLKSKTGLGIHYSLIPDTVRILDPLTLEEKVRLAPAGSYRVRLNGPYSLWDSLGNKIEEGRYSNERHNGIQRKWYPDGTLKSEVSFANGWIAGTNRYWHPSGVIQRIESYTLIEKGDSMWYFDPVTYEEKYMINNWERGVARDGEWVYYNEDSELVKKEVYQKGKKIFTHTKSTLHSKP